MRPVIGVRPEHFPAAGWRNPVVAKLGVDERQHVDSKQAGRAGPGSVRRVSRHDIERADADPIGNGPGHRLDDE